MCNKNCGERKVEFNSKEIDVKYLRKNIPCNCLDEKYKEVKSITKRGCATIRSAKCLMGG